MKVKGLITVFGVLNVLQGFFLFFNAENLVIDSFPGVSEEAIQTGVLIHYPFGAMTSVVGIILLFIRHSPLEVLKNALKGYGFGVALVMVSVVLFSMDGGIAPMPLIAANLILMGLSFYGAFRGK